MRGGLVVGLLATFACQRDLPEGRFRCDDDSDCPSGMRCGGGLCFTDPPDASFDASAVTDSGLADAADSAPVDAGAPCNPTPARVLVSAPVTAPTTWGCDSIYQLEGVIDVRAVLTIERGTRIEGVAASALVVHPSGRLVARGTLDQPIVFTRAAGTMVWSGVALLGDAPVGSTMPVTFAGAPGTFGGDDSAHDCGELRYVRIEHAGESVVIEPRSPYFNGLNLDGCGTDTRVSHVQIHGGIADSLEVLGGAVRLDHIVVTEPDDEAVTWDYGWTGGIQFLVVHNGATTMGTALEGGSTTVEPLSAPRFYNTTILGAGRPVDAVNLEARSGFTLRNSIIAHFGGTTLRTDPATEAEIPARISIEDAIVFDIGRDGMTFIEPAFAAALGAGINHVDPELRLSNLRSEPATADSPAATIPGSAPPVPYDVSADFLGAIERGNDWTFGWTVDPS